MKKLKGFLLSFMSCVTVCALAIPLAACNSDTETGSESQNLLSSISLDTSNAKTTFILGDEFTSEGLIVYAIFSTDDGSVTEDVSEDALVDSIKYDSSTIGTYSIDVAYDYNGMILYASYTVAVTSNIVGTIMGIDVSYTGNRQIDLTSENTTATIDLSGLSVSKVVGEDVNNTTVTPLSRNEYSISYSKDGGELVAIDADQTSISGLGKGVYTLIASMDFTVGTETYTASSFVTVYVTDPVVSIVKNEGGTLEYEYNTTETIGSDWTYTVTYGSGATAQVAYKDVVLGDAAKNVVGENTVTVSYTESVMGFDDDTQDVTSVSKTVYCYVTYTIGENPNAGQTVTETIELDMADVYAAMGSTVADGTELITADCSSSGIYVVRSGGMSVNASNAGDYTYRLQFGGGISSSALKIVTKGEATITAVFRSSSSSAAREVGLFSSMSTSSLIGETQSVNAGLDNSTDTVTFTVSEAGTYYLGSLDSGINLYYIKVVQTYVAEGGSTETSSENVTFNANDLAIGTISEETNLTADGSVSVLATAENTVEVDENTKSLNGFSFTQRLKLSGEGTAEYRSVKITTTGAATITIYAMSSSSSADRALIMYDVDFASIDDTQIASGSSLTELTFTISGAGTYYFTSASGGINIYYIAVTY